jgi:hypothetical protein
MLSKGNYSLKNDCSPEHLLSHRIGPETPKTSPQVEMSKYGTKAFCETISGVDFLMQIAEEM